LQTTPTFEVGAFVGASSLDPGPCAFFELDVGAGLTIQRLALGYDDVALVGTPARVELWLVNITAGQNGGTLFANLPQLYLHNPPTQPGSQWVLASSTTVTIAAPGTPSSTASIGLHLNPGRYGVCLVSVPNGTTATTTAPTANRLHPTAVQVPGGRIADQFLTITARGVGSTAFGFFVPSPLLPVLRIDYAADPSAAYWSTYGNGCYGLPQSFYQAFNGPSVPQGAPPAITTIAPNLRFVPQSNPFDRYLVQPGTGTYPLMGTPGTTTHYDATGGGNTPTHVNGRAPSLSYFGNNWDDANSVLYPLPFPLQHPGGVATAISICSNGLVFLGSPTGQPQFQHHYQQFCLGPAAFAVAFADLWPADHTTFTGGTGEIYADSDGATWVAISWVNCREYPNTPNATSGNSFQVVFHASGLVDYAWSNCRNSDSAPLLIGYTPGNGTTDPGAGLASPRATPDLATAVLPTGYLSGSGVIAPALACDNRPRVGGPLSMTISNLDTSIVSAITFISGGATTGIDLGPAGLPGCALHVQLPELLAITGVSAGGVIQSNVVGPGTIPTAIAGIDFFAQSACLSTRAAPVNALNVFVSNGVCLHVDVN
jgi:hypothetical protein